MTFAIRLATRDDYEGISELFIEIDELHHQAHPDIFAKTAESVRPESHLAEILADETQALFVAEDETESGQVVGFIQVKIKDAPDISMFVPRKIGYINELVIKADRQRSGLGQLLMKQAHAWLLAQNIHEVQLHVWIFNDPAIQFYDALGYTSLNQLMSRSLP